MPLGGWFRSSGGGGDDGGNSTSNNSSTTNVAVADLDAAAALRERENLRDALAWTSLIMNDDIDGAWAGLRQGDSSFHDLGEAVAFFVRSVLGFEKDVMAEAAAKLSDCETRAANDHRRALRHHQQQQPSPAATPRVYAPGTEYDLVRAESQLMGAVVGVLHESLVEAMRSFYKLRKAYLILDGIIASEAKAVRDGLTDELALESDGDDSSSGSSSGSGSDEFVDAKEKPSGQQTPTTATTTTTTATTSSATTPEPGPPRETLETKTEALKLTENGTAPRPDGSSSPPPSSPPQPKQQHPARDPVDVFIHSGANMCFGIILLILSLTPPSFSRVLSVVGFHGDRARGVRMLWRSAAHRNVNGALAGMVLLAYYNGLLGTVDIIPDARDHDAAAEAVGPPMARCEALLADLRARYPDSQLWRVEEARLLANERRLADAIALLRQGPESKMKQVAALNNFELAVNAMIAQDWPLMRDTFLRCLEVNDWSPAMYYYMAGCASIELYRDAAHAEGGDADENKAEARRQKLKAEEYLRKAPQVGGKKRLMARQLPLETFIQRKLQKWEARAKALGVGLADAVGASPAMEMCYMWSGHKRMGPDETARGLANMRWERCTAADDVVARIRAEKDESAVWAVSSAALLRTQGKLDEARALLEEHVVAHDRSVFKGSNRDDYVLPSATHELAVIAWTECREGSPPATAAAATTATKEDGDGASSSGTTAGEAKAEDVDAYRRRKLDECQAQLDKAKAWEAYTLDARVGMRVQSGLETVAWYRRKMGW